MLKQFFLSALILSAAPISYAQFGSGIVFDPTQSAHAAQQILQANQLYTTTVETERNIIGAYNLAQKMASLTIEEMVKEIDKGIEPDQPLADIFTGSLLAVGYLAGDPAGLRPYRISKLRSYRVEDNFPRLRLSAVPLGVIEAKYTIDLGRCVPFEVSEDSNAD